MPSLPAPQLYGGAPPYTCTATGLPPSLSFDGTNFVGTADPGTEGIYTVTLNCTDGNGAMASTTFQLEICETTIVCPHWCEIIKAYSGGHRSCYTEITSCVSTVDDLTLGGTITTATSQATTIDSPLVAGDYVLVNGPNGELFLYCLQTVSGTLHTYKIIQLVGATGTGSPIDQIDPITAGHTYADENGCKWLFVSDSTTYTLTDQRWYSTNCDPCPPIPLEACGNIRKTVGVAPVIGDEQDGDTTITDIGVFEWQAGAWVYHSYLYESSGVPTADGLIVGQTTVNTVDGTTYEWDGTAWVVKCEVEAKDGYYTPDEDDIVILNAVSGHDHGGVADVDVSSPNIVILDAVSGHDHGGVGDVDVTTSGHTDPDFDAYEVRLTGSYTQAELDAICDYFVCLKTAGIYSKIDVLYIHALDNASDGLLNIKGATFTASNNGMLFTPREGFTGGSGNYIDTTFAPSTDGVAMTQNSASLSIYVRANVSEAGYDIGARTTSTRRNYIASRWSNNITYGKITGGNNNFAQSSNINSQGFWNISRTASNAMDLYKSGAVVGSETSPSIALVEFSIYIGALNRGGTASDFASKQYALSVIGGGLSASEVSDFNACTQTLMTALGANV